MQTPSCTPGQQNRNHVHLASSQKCAEVYAQLDISEADANDFDEVRR